MEDKTYVFVKYILFFFGLIFLLSIIYFVYTIYYNDSEKVVIPDDTIDSNITDTFDDLLKYDLNKDINKKKEGYVNYEENNCYIDDLMIKSGERVVLYSRKIVNPYEDCEDFSKERVCDNGFMLGNEKFKFTSCKKDLDCQLPDNSILKNGESIKLYSKKSVSYGDTCERYSQVRKCKETILTGDKRYIYKRCVISYDNSCDVGGGRIMANNQTHVFYKKSVVPYGESCSDYAKRLMCSNATIQGGSLEEYRFWDCIEESPKDCYIDGVKIEHGSLQVLYSKKYGTPSRSCDFFKEIRACNNGKLDGQPEYKYFQCYDN